MKERKIPIEQQIEKLNSSSDLYGSHVEKIIIRRECRSTTIARGIAELCNAGAWHARVSLLARAKFLLKIVNHEPRQINRPANMRRDRRELTYEIRGGYYDDTL